MVRARHNHRQRGVGTSGANPAAPAHGRLERVEPAVNQLCHGVVPFAETWGDGFNSLKGQSLMKRRQARKRGSQAGQCRGMGQVGRARQPRRDFPETALVILKRSTRSIADGNRDESQLRRLKEPLMNLLEVLSARPVGGPGAKDERAAVRAVAPEPCAAETAAAAQRQDRRSRLKWRGIPCQDFFKGSTAHSGWPARMLVCRRSFLHRQCSRLQGEKRSLETLGHLGLN